jgi:hypothetical protein
LGEGKACALHPTPPRPLPPTRLARSGGRGGRGSGKPQQHPPHLQHPAMHQAALRLSHAGGCGYWPMAALPGSLPPLPHRRQKNHRACHAVTAGFQAASTPRKCFSDQPARDPPMHCFTQRRAATAADPVWHRRKILLRQRAR